MERFVVEIVYGIGNQNTFPSEGVKDCTPTFQWGVVFVQSQIHQFRRYFIVFEEFFEDMCNTGAFCWVGEPVLALSA